MDVSLWSTADAVRSKGRALALSETLLLHFLRLRLCADQLLPWLYVLDVAMKSTRTARDTINRELLLLLRRGSLARLLRLQYVACAWRSAELFLHWKQLCPWWSQLLACCGVARIFTRRAVTVAHVHYKHRGVAETRWREALLDAESSALRCLWHPDTVRVPRKCCDICGDTTFAVFSQDTNTWLIVPCACFSVQMV